MVTELLESLKGQKLDNTLIAGANVQEEVGLRGAHVSATKFQPELFFAVDCSPAGDIYGNQGKIGDGTLFRFYDPGHVMLKDMRDFLLTTAEEAGIKYQYYAAKGGTDAGAAHLKTVVFHQQLSEYALATFTHIKAFMLWMTSYKPKLSFKLSLRN